MDNNRPVKFGTPIHNGAALCTTCRHATRIAGLAESQRYVFCDELSSEHNPIRLHVVECSSYDDRAKPTLQAFENVAWKLATDKSGHKIGFKSPEEFRKLKTAKKLADEAPTLVDPITGDRVYTGD